MSADAAQEVHGLLMSEEFTAPQGEGPNMGRPMYWLRLGGCKQACKWCDANYAVFYDPRKAALHETGERFDPRHELTRHSVQRVASRISGTQFTTVAVTGGEPLHQQENVAHLIRHPLTAGRSWEFETSGIEVPWALAGLRNVRFNVSPKLASSGNPRAVRRSDEAMLTLLAIEGTIVKFVLDTRDGTYKADLTEVEYLCRRWAIPPAKVWVMPCGTTADEVAHGMVILEPIALDRQWNLSGRLQVFMHGDARGF